MIIISICATSLFYCKRERIIFWWRIKQKQRRIVKEVLSLSRGGRMLRSIELFSSFSKHHTLYANRLYDRGDIYLI